MEVKVTISATCYSMERRFIILIEKALDNKCNRAIDGPSNMQVLIPMPLNVTFVAKGTL